MIKIDNVLINANMRDILEYLKQDLAIKGIERFAIFKPNNDDIQTNCPFHKNGQERKPSFGINVHTGQCHCFRGDTKVITKYGTYEIKDLCDKYVQILNGNGEWEFVKFSYYGKRRLYDIKLTRDTKEKHIFATDKHRWIVHNKNKKCGYDVVFSEDLVSGKYLESVYPKKYKNVDLDPYGIVHGFCYGDGSLTGKTKTKYRHRCIFYNESDLKLLPYFKNLGKVKKVIAGNGKEYNGICFSSERNLKEVPNIHESISYLLGFLAGYFVADGNFFDGRASICSYNLSDIKKIRDIATRCGIVTNAIGINNIKSGQRGCVYVKSDKQSYNLHFAVNTLPDNFFITTKGNNDYSAKYIRCRYKVVSTTKTDIIDDVYCCQTSTSTFALEDFILTGNCFTCGWSGPVNKMIGEIFLQDEEYGTRWLVKHFNSTEIETRQKIVELPFQRGNGKSMSQLRKCIEDSELNKYRYTHSYMYNRGLTDELIEEFDIGYDKENDTITFPCYDVHNQLLFIARRSINGKMYKYPSDVEKPVYALNKVVRERIKRVYVVESFFNCLTLWKFGIPSIAMIGTGTKEQYEILKKSNIREYVLAFDPDDAGRKATQRFRRAMSNYASIKEVVYVEDGKDINDLQEDFLKLKIVL